jgi:hypothetical protein
MKTIVNSLWVLLVGVSLLSGCTDKVDPVVIEYGTVNDNEGNTYKTVKIGDQWWMAENLATRYFNNGDPLALASSSDSIVWSQAGFPSYCIYQGDPAAPGFLYNFYAITDIRGIAPQGWHIATDEDWKKLESFIGLSNAEKEKTGWRGAEEGDLLKQKGQNEWVRYDGVWAEDKYGFSAKAGGCRLPDGKFSVPSGLTYSGFWWTTTDKQSGKAWYRYMDYKSSKIFRSYTYYGYGMSIRCVKD